MHRPDQVGDGRHRLTLHALVRARADVGRDQAIRKLRERVVGRRRFLIEHVGAIAPHFAGGECCGHVGRVDDLATGAVEDDHAWLHRRDRLGPHHVAGLRREVRVEREVIGGGKDLVERGGPRNSVFLREGLVPVDVVADRLHSEGLCPDRHFLADPTHAHDPDRLVEQFVAGLSLPATAPDGIGVEEQVLLEGQQQQEGVLGDGRVIHARGEEQRDAKLRACLHVDLVDTDAVLREHLEPWPGFFQHRPRDRVVAANEAVNVAHERERVGLGERTASPDDLPARGGERLVVRAGRVLEGGGGDEDSGRHGKVPRGFEPGRYPAATESTIPEFCRRGPMGRVTPGPQMGRAVRRLAR